MPEKISPAFAHLGGREGTAGRPNSGPEPNDFSFLLPASSSEFEHALSGSTLGRQKTEIEEASGDVDEGRVALLDTACTSCLHSARWRQHYEQTLPEGVFCEATKHSKLFHFANGEASEGRLTVWRVPIFLQGHAGEVFSAEMEQGGTPLLLSIPAMEALDMVLYMKERRVDVNVLHLSLPMLLTKTKHLAVTVAFDENDIPKQEAGEKPRAQAEDILVYFVEESRLPLLHQAACPTDEISFLTGRGRPDLGPRGVHPKDPTGSMTQRRAAELKKAAGQQQAKDRRAWLALRRDFSLAEQFATLSFQRTVVFEPFSQDLALTRVAAEERSWTCTQPLDLIDGADLWQAPGRKLVNDVLADHQPYLTFVAASSRLWAAFRGKKESEQARNKMARRALKFVCSLCVRQHQAGRYYLLELPATANAWEFEGILGKLLEEHGGKFVCGDLCRYGRRDLKTLKPIRGRTGWLSNSEAVLNHLGKQCQCPFGAHLVVKKRDQEEESDRRLQPHRRRIAQAICQGLAETMELDYGAAMAFGSTTQDASAFPAGAEEEMETDGEDTGDEDYEEPWEDDWRFDEVENKLIRVHRVLRRKLFIPLASTAPPCNFGDILGRRRTRMVFADGTRREHEDDWHEASWRPGGVVMDQAWTGETEFWLQPRPRAEQERPPQQPQSPPRSPGPGHGLETPGTAPFDSAVYQDDEEMERYSPSLEEPGEQLPLPASYQEAPEVLAEQERPQQPQSPPDHRVLKRRQRTRQLQRGFWSEVDHDETRQLLEGTLDYVQQQGAEGWNKINVDSDLGKAWVSLESANADVTLILCSAQARRLKKPQPFAGPHEVPLRKSFLLLGEGKVLTTDWEAWHQMSPASQIRPLVAADRKLYVGLFGKEVGDDEPGDEPDRQQQKEEGRQRKWAALPRELKLAIKRVHENLGHASQAAMLRALRIAKASETAVKACRLFRCPACPRLLEPKHPRPSKLPFVNEFNVMVGIDVLTEKDSAGQAWSWLNIFCQGTCFQVCRLLETTHSNPTGAVVLEALNDAWLVWAGYPEYGLITDRGKYFLAEVAEELAGHGCHVEPAARASPWQLGQIERHGGIWKASFRRAAWAQQVAGLTEVKLLTAAINQGKNSLTRKAGFSPAQWVLGRDLRLPADLADDGEVARIGAQALTATPGSIFFRKAQLRQAAREAFARAANDDALRRAELRQVRPSRGPFSVGSYVFYYDAAHREPGPNCWRGVARVVGREGSHTVWVSHRGILLAVSPEHLAKANEEEVNQWLAIGDEVALLDAVPASGGTGFIDLRQQPKPPQEPGEGDPGAQDQGTETGAQREAGSNEDAVISSSQSEARQASERDAARDRRSSEFFLAQEAKRRKPTTVRGEMPMNEPGRSSQGPAPQDVPVDPTGEDDLDLFDGVPELEFDPEVHSYRHPPLTRQLSPIADNPEAEAQEREAKRQRVVEQGHSANFATEVCDAFFASSEPNYLHAKAQASYKRNERAYLAAGITQDVFLFGFKRNSFQERYEALAATGQGKPEMKKKGRKELYLKELDAEKQKLFTGPEGSDAKEWAAWQGKEACDVLPPAESERIRRSKPDLIIPTRWVRTNKNDGLVGQEFKAKSRLVVQGFKDKALGSYRRDAPTASQIAESICLAVCAFHKFVLFAKDIKNAYFSGKNVQREIYLEQPRGGLPGLAPGQLLKARKAIYGFAEAARLFWLALREHLISDGWQESKLEPALFYYRVEGRLLGILVTHVDDLEGGVHPKHLDSAFARSAKALEFATNHFRDFIFRGREVKQNEQHHIDVSMRNYALSLKTVTIPQARRQQLAEELTPEEQERLQSAAGELGWLTRQLRCDLAYENGVIQRCKGEACVADLVRLKQYIGMARRGADFKMRYWSDVNLDTCAVLHLADSGHANGTPDHNEELRYRSVGGYFLLLANKEILEGREARVNIVAYHSTLTKRVCRSTLAAEASHLAEAVEAGDWVTVLLEEALSGGVDLKNWDRVIEQRQRVYITDARSVFDYLSKDATSTSSDKRMAIEGALLRETVRKPGAWVRWIDGAQNVANVLTKAGAEKDTLRDLLRSGKMSLVQSEANQQLKLRKQAERARRKVKVDEHKDKSDQKTARRARVAQEVAAEGLEDDEADGEL